METGSKPTVFYDGACPLCSREIKHYQRLRGAERIKWIDASKDSESLDQVGLSKDRAMARFHVLDTDGQWKTGAYGFAEMWSHLPAYRWLGVGTQKLGLLPLMDMAYERFARWRLRKTCTNDNCAVKR